MPTSVVFNEDCMKVMSRYPDKYFDLAVVDPPYGGGCSQSVDVEREREQLIGGHADWDSKPRGRFGGRFARYNIRGATISAERTGGKWAKKYQQGSIPSNIKHWDIAPPQEYFDELARVSKNQIIWGGNYFNLPPTRCFLVWDKKLPEDFTMAMAEYAWTSFNDNAKIFRFVPQGKAGFRFHPTQKPVELYAWIYSRYAEEGYKILDTHLGSGSSRIAAYDAGLDFVGCEVCKEYFDESVKWFENHTSQISFFD